MTVLPQGNLNTTALTVPDLYIQISPPQNAFINGIPTNILGMVGTASWGPVNSPTVLGSINQYVQQFGPVLTNTFDMGTHVAVAALQGANNFRCVRVTDGTDAAASVAVVDQAGSPATGLTLSAYYTGTVGNTISAVVSAGTNSTGSAPTYKLTLAIPGGVPEIFDNIGGATNPQVWANMVNAVNLGQTGRGPSQLCIATLANYISSVSVTNAGSYATLPTLGTSGNGSGAVFVGTMKAVSATVTAAGTGYAPTDTITITGGTHTVNAIFNVATTKLVSVAVNVGGANYQVGDTIVLAGGTFGTAAVLTVSSVSLGAVTAVTISNAGSYTANTTTFTQGSTSGVGSGATFNTAVWGVNTLTVNTVGAYTALPSSPVSQGSTSGSGTGATLTVLWGLLSVAVSNGGSGYDSTSAFTVTGGGGTGGATGTLALSSGIAPKLTSYTLSGGSNGITGVNTTTLIGQDVSPRKGMYALRSTGCSVVDLCDHTASGDWSTITQYGLSEGSYMIEVAPAGQAVATTLTNLQNAGVDSYAMSLIAGDWVYWNDPYNLQLRLISPQGFKAGLLAALSPQNSALNKQLFGITGTQTSYANQTYSAAQLQAIAAARLDVITNPSPGGSYYSFRFGRNCSSNVVINGDNYTRLTNYIAYSLNSVMGVFVGQLQSTSEQTRARSTLQAFLSNLQAQGMIGNVSGGPAFSVILDSSNNPPSRVALGYQQADVQVVYLSVINYFVINVQGGQSVTIQKLATPPVAA